MSTTLVMPRQLCLNPCCCAEWVGYRVTRFSQANGLLYASALVYVRMPVRPEFTWQQTLESVTVRVQVPGVTRCKPDVFATSALLKVNALPCLFHLDLMHDVEDAKTVAAVTDQGVTFTLIKVGGLPCCLMLST